MIKKTIHFSNEDLHQLDILINMIGVKGYGDIPKALKFGVTFAIQELKRQSQVLPDLNQADLEIYIASVKKIRENQERVKIAEKVLKEGVK